MLVICVARAVFHIWTSRGYVPLPCVPTKGSGLARELPLSFVDRALCVTCQAERRQTGGLCSQTFDERVHRQLKV
jgi:hypothetical protein